jgi:Flp pilus assembly protein TadD
MFLIGHRWSAPALCGCLALTFCAAAPAREWRTAEEARAWGDLCLAEGRFRPAIAAYSHVIGLCPQDAGAYCGRGIAYRQTGRHDLAIADLTMALRLDPRYAEAYYGRALAYEKKGEKSKAADDFARSRKLGYKPPDAAPGQGSLQR